MNHKNYLADRFHGERYNSSEPHVSFFSCPCNREALHVLHVAGIELINLPTDDECSIL